MKIAVFAKQIPNSDIASAIDAATNTLERPGPLVLDDSDTYSVEVALQLADQVEGSEVTLVSMSPDNETAGLRTALAMGAAKAVLVSDPALAGSDALSTAKVLAAAVRHAGAELVLTATESTDGYTGTVPVQVAELLGWPSVSFAKKVELVNGELHVERQTETGYDEVVCPLPAVVSVTAGVVEPWYPSFKGIMSAKSKPVDELGLGDLGIDPPTVGSSGAREQVISVEAAPVRPAGEIVTDEGDAFERIIALLVEEKIL